MVSSTKLSRFFNFETNLFIILLTVMLLGALVPSRHTRLTDETFTVPSSTHLTAQFADDDKVEIPIAAGEQVRIVGYSGDGLFLKYLVETEDGTRAYLRPDQIDIPVMPKYGTAKGKAVKVTKASFYDNGEIKDYEGVLDDGTTVESLRPTNFLPLFDGADDMQFESEPRQRIMTKGALEAKLAELTPDNCEKLVGPVQMRVPTRDGGTRISFFADALDRADGHLYRPSVTFAPDGTATAVAYNDIRYRNGYALRYLPFVDKIADMPLTSWLIRSELYKHKFGPGVFQTVLKYGSYIIYCIAGLLWIFCLGALPMALMWALMHIRQVYYPLGDRMLIAFVAIVGAISAYYWYICLVLWGAYALFALLMLPVAAFIYILVADTLTGGIPHRRCPSCRRLDTIVHVSTDDLGSSTHSRDVDVDRVVRDNSTAVESYTKVTYRDGYSEKRNRSVTTNIDRDMETATYHQQVRTDRYRDHFRCCACGHTESCTGSHSTVLSSKRTGIKRWRHRDTIID